MEAFHCNAIYRSSSNPRVTGRQFKHKSHLRPPGCSDVLNYYTPAHMPDGVSSNTSPVGGLAVLVVVSLATLAYIGRSRLRSKYVSAEHAHDGCDSNSINNSSTNNSSVVPDPAAEDAVVEGADSGGDARARALPGEGQEEGEEVRDLPGLLTASPRCWENPLVLGFNKLKARTTLGAFTSAEQARCEVLRRCSFCSVPLACMMHFCC